MKQPQGTKAGLDPRVVRAFLATANAYLRSTTAPVSHGEAADSLPTGIGEITWNTKRARSRHVTASSMSWQIGTTGHIR